MAEDHQTDHHLDHRVDEALRVAQRYYLHGVTMDVIARQMGTSRSTVSRLLQYARDSGLVEIRVLPPDSRAHPLEQSLAESFGVRAHVAHVPSTATPARPSVVRSGHRMSSELMATPTPSSSVSNLRWTN